MPITSEILSKELLVATEILRLEGLGAEPVYFNRICSSLASAGKNVSRSTVSRAMDMLFDQGMVKAEWVTRPSDGKHVRSLKIAGEARGFVQGILTRLST